ncbi:hypothetical protein [Nonomuraea sp. SYSU D8015]|uniref:hypothetical protein n=1 Tax=Nonomuraea sp. SYSU D8015 TaxID=2593644 RepID=UPI001660906C|nr:hypothetical protein [Nonomuraea sp. SYSU D8015]
MPFYPTDILPLGLPVKVHYNLHKCTYSVTARSGPMARRVIADAEAIILRNVTFHVSAKGRARYQRSRQRSVHAWVTGEVISAFTLVWNENEPLEPEVFELTNLPGIISDRFDLRHMVRVTYHPSPTRPSTFTTVEGAPVGFATCALFARPSPESEHGYVWLWPSGPHSPGHTH